MERKVVVVCCAVGFLGLLSAALGFAAEATRVKASDVQVPAPPALGQCTYPRSAAFSLGLGSAVTLMMAQAIINTVAGCICCRRNSQPSDTKWSAALISFIVSWIMFIIAFLLLLTGAALNDQKEEQNMYFGDYCYVVKPGVFSAGAVLSLASVSFGIVYYVALSTSKNSSVVSNTWSGPTPENRGTIAMGQVVVPPQSTEPVFVHEDTYNRQQFP